MSKIHLSAPPLIAGATLAIHGGRTIDPLYGAITPPIVQSSTFAQDGIGGHRGHTYSRVSNPTVTALEQALASFEGMAHAYAFASGMAALSALALATLRSGDHALCSRIVYGGTLRLFDELLAPLGIALTPVETTDVTRVEAAIRPATKLLLVETPANPTLEVSDLRALGAIAKKHGLILAVDNTFLTAALQRPGELGADVVVYSTTKYVDGHNAAIGGALVLDDSDLGARIDRVRKTIGAIQAPFPAWITLQGLKTLPLRLRVHSESALALAEWLSRDGRVNRVHYPFLASNPQRELAFGQQAAGGGIVSFDIKGGIEAARAFAASLRLCTVAENLGAIETLVTHPATMTHGDLDPQRRRGLGIGDGLLRLSVGLEDVDDIRADLDQALAIAAKAVR